MAVAYSAMMSAIGTEQTWASALHMSAFGGNMFPERI